MNDKQNGAICLAHDIYSTEQNEIQCDAASDAMILSTEAGLPADASRRQHPMLWHHMAICVDCAREYQMLVELTQVDLATASLPEQIPPIPQLAPVGVGQQLSNVITQLFPGFGPAMQSALTRGSTLSIDPVEIELGAGELLLEIDVEANEHDPRRRDLYCQIDTEVQEEMDALEGAPIWLRRAEDEEHDGTFLEQSLDELGSTFFQQLHPGTYMFGLQVSDRTYSITDITLP